MKKLKISLITLSTLFLFDCVFVDDSGPVEPPVNTEVDFQPASTIDTGQGSGSAEISAFDAESNRLFVTSADNQIRVYDVSDINQPTTLTPIDLTPYGSAPNSVSVYDGKVAVAVEALDKQSPGTILVYNAADLALINQYTVGAMPDMVTFTKDGNFILSADEGEPNQAYTVDPMGTVSIIDLNTDVVTTLDFTSFNSQEAALEAGNFRVNGPNADLAKDVEPEYITVSEDSQTAWVSLQENNGIAKINILTKTIEAIYPLGYKDHSFAQNSLDASDKDNVAVLKQWPVRGLYQPDGITSVKINGAEYIISANEGDSRSYSSGFEDADRIKDFNLDPIVFPASFDYQDNDNMGRLDMSSTEGDIDGDGDYDEVYTFGTRSFSVWTADGALVYDSGNTIAANIIAETPSAFNDDRSDKKGMEPESVDVLNIGDQRYVLFVALERTNQVIVYDITNPTAPEYLTLLSKTGDESPEGLLVIPSDESPSGKDLLVVTNEGSGTITFYENQQ